MKPAASSLRRILVLLSLVVGLGLASQTYAADEKPAGEPAGWVAIPDGYKKADVQQAITDVLAKRGWQIKETTDGKVVGYYRHHRNEATLTLLYDDKQITLVCEGYRIDRKTGERQKPQQPESWLKYVRQDLGKMLGSTTSSTTK